MDRWSSQSLQSYAIMKKIVHVNLKPALQRLMIHLGDLVGMSRW